jgi:hypothetical protein
VSAAIQVTFDAADPAGLAGFWKRVLGYIEEPPPEGWTTWEDWAREQRIPEERWNDQSAIVDADGVGPRIFFQKVPEGKTAKNRVHLDVRAAPGLDGDARRARLRAEAERLIEAGAAELYEREERGAFWITMQDPEGNEFCLD